MSAPATPLSESIDQMNVIEVAKTDKCLNSVKQLLAQEGLNSTGGSIGQDPPHPDHNMCPNNQSGG